jgi:hypothetical protein
MRQSKIFFFLLAAAVSVTSCLKKDRMNIDQEQGPKNVIEFDNTGNNAAKVTSKYPGFYTDLGVLATGQSKTFNINVSYSGADVAPEDITVKLEIDQAALDKYNEDNGTEFIIPPSDVISFPSTLVIKKGERKATGTATVTISNNYDYNVGYGLPLKIASASSGLISGNFGKVVYSFGVRNKFDGEYEVTGTMVDHGSSTLKGYFPMKYWLITSGALSVDGYDPVRWEDYFIPIYSGTSISGYGSFSPVFTFDEANNIVSVTNIYGQPAGNTRYAQLDPSGVNKYDPATGTIKVKFFMYQPSVIASGPRVEFDWTLTRKGDRP